MLSGGDFGSPAVSPPSHGLILNVLVWTIAAPYTYLAEASDGLPLLCGRRQEFGDILPHSLAELNPQGCQRVAGGRSPFALNDHRKAASDSEHPEGSARAARWPPRASPEADLAPLPGCRRSPTSLTGGRRPHYPRRPPATLWQPCGLTKPKRPTSSYWPETRAPVILVKRRQPSGRPPPWPTRRDTRPLWDGGSLPRGCTGDRDP